jgi:hypothetical protein
VPAAKAPPTYPTDLEQIRDAVTLLGHVKRRGDLSLNQWQRERLVRYVGRMPANKNEAHRWKLYLRALRRDAAAEPEEDEG